MSWYYLQLCRTCFYAKFEEEIHWTIVQNKLFKRGEKVAIGASGINIFFLLFQRIAKRQIPASPEKHLVISV